MKLLINGDGSPVRDDVIKLGGSYGLSVIIVTSIDHYTAKEYASRVQIVYVGHRVDSANYKIVGMVKRNDFLITQSYGLASPVLPKGARVFHHSGKEFDEANIGTLFEQRYHSGKLGKAGIRTEGPKPFTDKDHTAFCQALRKTIDRGLPGTEDSR